MNAPFWNDERLKKLAELWVNPDLSASAIAKELGTTKGAILGKAHRIGLAESHPKRPSYSPQHKPPVVTMAVAGSEAPVKQPPKESGEWRGAPVPVDLDEAAVLKIQAAADRIPKDGLPLLRLEPHHCRWPTGEKPWRFCAKPRLGGKYSFCEEHAKRAFTVWPVK